MFKPFYEILKNRNRDLATYFTPVEVAKLYGFPEEYDGTGQKIGIIQLGGGYILSDIHFYLQNIGITKIPNIVDISVNGAQNNPSDISGANFEVYLDLEIIASISPGSDIRIYFAPNSIDGFYSAIYRATIDNCDIISISWGLTETYLRQIDLDRYNNLFKNSLDKKIYIFCASGDRGATDGTSVLNVNFPSSSPNVIACGGTTLNSENNTYISELVWNNNPTTSSTGGGVSRYFNKPSYQNNIDNITNYTKRAVPDISGNANPKTGYRIYIKGEWFVIGGTSAVSPLWSGLIARVNQSINSRITLLHNKLYNAQINLCTDIISGNNGGYNAQYGFDLCTGWGTPNLNLISYLCAKPYVGFKTNVSSGSVPLTVEFTNTSTLTSSSRSWDFGNGFTSNLQNPTIVFSAPGTYKVKLTIESITVEKTIKVLAITKPPVSSFTALTVNFKDTSKNNPTSWLWVFGDGTSSTEQNPIHTFPSMGNYNVKLTVKNSLGTTTSNSLIRLG